MDIRPRWLSHLTILAAVPVFAQLVDFMVQTAAHTPGLKTATVGMVCWALLSASFHLHLMRNGAMLVGGQGRSFANDLKRVPWLVGTFCAAPVVVCRDALRAARTDQAAERELAV